MDSEQTKEVLEYSIFLKKEINKEVSFQKIKLLLDRITKSKIFMKVYSVYGVYYNLFKLTDGKKCEKEANKQKEKNDGNGPDEKKFKKEVNSSS